MQQFVDSRCRYWIQQRIGEMMNNNNFTSSHGLTLSIETDPNAGGYCFNFSRNGQTIAKINENGLVTCSSLWINGLNILSILNTHNLDIRGLTDGTFDLNVHSIIADIGEFTTINDYPISPTIQTFPYIPVVDSYGVIPLNTIATNLLNIFASNNADVELHIGKDTNYGIVKYSQDDSTFGFGHDTEQNIISFDLTSGAINGAIVGPIDSVVTPTVPFLPVVKTNDLSLSIGRRLDFSYNLGDNNYSARIECEEDGAIRITNNHNSVNPLRIMSQSSSSVQVQFGKRTGHTNDCAIIQYNSSGPTLGFGFWNRNNKMTFTPNGDLSVSGTLTTSSNASIGGTLTTSSDATINGSITTSSNASIGGTLTTSSDVTINGSITTSSDAEIQGDLLVDGDIEAHQSINVYQDVQIGRNLSVVNTATIEEFDTTTKQMILRLMYPIGSVYMSATSHDNPNVIFGVNVGTWTEITSDKYIRSCDSTGTLREEGGSFYHDHTTSDHTLTIDEIPAHYHDILGSKSNTPGSNPSDCVPLMNYGNVSEYWERNNYNTTYIKDTGGGLAHNHGNTSQTLTEPPYYKVHMWYRSA